MNVTKQITKNFGLSCIKCGSKTVIVDFYPGHINDNGGDTGTLSFTCRHCKIEFDIDAYEKYRIE